MSERIIYAKAGPYRGRVQDGLQIFQGVPFAAPPTGARRFRRAEALDRHSAIADSTRPGPPSPQRGSARPENEEGCLTLNIWAPEKAARLPVMFFIHGGSFIYGSGSEPLYDGGALARDGNIVVVTFNYRLGVFGCLDFSGADADFQSNCAFSDMTEALRWVYENIDAFGGDPENITVTGQSAGAIAATAFPVHPELRSMISKVVMMSGSPTYLRRKDEHQALGEEFLSRAGWGPEDLRKADTGELVKLGRLFQKTCGQGEGTYTLDVDGELIRESPVAAASKGAGAGIPALIGTTFEETAFVCSPLFSKSFDVKGPLEDALGREDPGKMAYLRNEYEEKFGDRAESLFVTERVFRMGSLWYAQMLGEHADAWLYRFDFESRTMRFIGLRACHSTDLPLFFGNLGVGFFRLMYLLERPENPHLRIMREMHDDVFQFMRDGRLPWQKCRADCVTAKIYDRETRFASAMEEPIRRAYEDTQFYRETFEGVERSREREKGGFVCI